MILYDEAKEQAKEILKRLEKGRLTKINIDTIRTHLRRKGYFTEQQISRMEMWVIRAVIEGVDKLKP